MKKRLQSSDMVKNHAALRMSSACISHIGCIGRRNGCGCHVSPAIFRFQFRPYGARIIRYITAGSLCRRIRRRFVRTSVIADVPWLLRIVVPVVPADGIIGMCRVLRPLNRAVLPVWQQYVYDKTGILLLFGITLKITLEKFTYPELTNYLHEFVNPLSDHIDLHN